MIFRRIKAHIEKENWFAVLIDFLIVVVGVFIGIQVANWNDNRQQRETTQHYLTCISEELVANQEDINQRLAYFRQTRAHAFAALEALEQSKDQLGVKFLVDIYQASQALPREIGRDCYDEVLSVGANHAIPDIEVRKRLANYYRSIASQKNNLESMTPYREIIRENLRYSVQTAIRAACDDITTTGKNGEPIISLPPKCNPSLDADEMANAVNDIFKLNIRNKLTRQLSDLDLKLTSGEIFIKRTILINEYVKDLPQ